VALGTDIDGEVTRDSSGQSVSLSADGLTLAIGAYRNDGSGSNAGHVRIYTWGASSSSWVQRGADIDGEDENDGSGRSVSLSADGQTVAIGAGGNDGAVKYSRAGHVRVYTWDTSSSAEGWVQRGVDIDGEAKNGLSGYSLYGSAVSLSADGQTVAIGATGNHGAGSLPGFNFGHVRIYTWDASSWVQRGADIDGEAAGDKSGNAVSLSADGLTVAIGATKNDGAGTGAGHVRVYSLE
jgi:hypothetical protein